jgi:hypothetical protein
MLQTDESQSVSRTRSRKDDSKLGELASLSIEMKAGFLM